MSNEIYVGSGTQATLIPESNILLGTACTYDNNTKKIITFSDTTLKLVPNLYVGCELKLVEGSDTQNILRVERKTDRPTVSNKKILITEKEEETLVVQTKVHQVQVQ